MKARNKRLILVGSGVALLVAAVALVLSAFQQNLVFFHTPSEVAAGKAPTGKTFRIGGMVEEGSIAREADGLTVRFAITDTAKIIPVTYRGTLPDLFKEGKGAVVQGRLEGGVFRATEVLAKHDENYMPPEAAHAVEQAQKAAQTVSQ
ncbi:cytochrome c maturation protein CcmE [Thauera aromatica]|uniref:Cytochrome c-type biogenesis protein CcmE n=1 Tax=Thauera aromatica K172 TaxID=44139 RepID=A0A2R4BIR8_THAAR|nr:cytochrome c maturation protein CcmE [Thauera aromatica]AVR87216.1 Cytochrome c-type biogenesis protein CcmE, heme chaperone [Thauera aromatica K172]MCK2087131.1 cytochrome c maturation protein CcmE [Thauera aromatica]MCK2097140.1 cytochrome c maturation protein CcmE [Thauera aromatica]MCK2127826.1 cytochrome c maturation protein CcmE [Thauera aromatica]